MPSCFHLSLCSHSAFEIRTKLPIQTPVLHLENEALDSFIDLGRLFEKFARLVDHSDPDSVVLTVEHTSVQGHLKSTRISA